MSDGSESTQLTVRLPDARGEDDHVLVVRPSGKIFIPKRLRDRLGSNRVAFIRRAGGNVTELYSVEPPLDGLALACPVSDRTLADRTIADIEKLVGG